MTSDEFLRLARAILATESRIETTMATARARSATRRRSPPARISFGVWTSRRGRSSVAGTGSRTDGAMRGGGRRSSAPPARAVLSSG
jgi:hypothetical protein